MPEENTAKVDNATQGATAEPERTFTQAELDAIVGDRLKRERAKQAEKYADYDEAKAALEELTQLKEASKTELEKAVEERDRLKSELDKLQAEREHAEKVAKVAAETGVDAALLARMSGDVDENAAFLKEQMGQRKFPAVPDNGEVSPPSATKTEIPKIF